MALDAIAVLGLTAGTFTTMAFLPQVIKTWKTRSTKDISLSMFVVFCIGVILWLLYGIFLKELPIILANSVTIFLALIILGFKIRYG